MKRSLLLLALASMLACPKAAEPAPPDPAAMRARVLEQVSSWQSYRAVLTSTMHVPSATGAEAQPMKTSLQIEAVLPNRMRVEGAGGAGSQRIEMIMTFDGKDVLATMLAGGAPKLLRVEQAIAPPERPFDTGLSMRGFGLFDGRDLQGSIRDLLTQWRFASVTHETFHGRRCLGLRGTLDVDVALEELTRQLPALEPTQIDVMAPAMARGLAAMTDAIVFVTEDGAVLGWTLSAGGKPMVETVVSSFTRDAAIPPERLTIDPAALARAADVTAQARASRAAPIDPAVHAAFKAQVRALLAPTPAPPAP